MRDFFNPWRRKAGVVTLAVACVFAAGWVGSVAGQSHVGGGYYQCGVEFIESGIAFHIDRIRQNKTKSKWIPLFTCSVPYWSVACPLTLLSASLLLSKPRQTVPKQPSEPAPTTGA